jgi:hypothetical protein
MNNALKAFRILLLVLSGLAITACDSEGPCSTNVISRVNAGIYTLSGGKESALTVGQLSLYALSRPDSVLQGSNVREFDFPLSMHEESTSYVMTADTVTDTLELSYTSNLVWLSTACGFTASFTIREVNHTRHFIDSISLVNTIVDLYDVENLKIFH